MLYIFDNYVLDANRRELRCGTTPVAIEPQVFDVLLYLIRHREHVVSRDELIESIWGGRHVSESALSTRINAVRSAVGDSGTGQRLDQNPAPQGRPFHWRSAGGAKGARSRAREADRKAARQSEPHRSRPRAMQGCLGGTH